ncbi:MAG: (Fe-S)-binding protein [Candidatus Kapaibacterium sp.]
MSHTLHRETFSDRSKKLQACIHCGLCLEACPTYLVTGEEMSGPRGRIYLMKALGDGNIVATDEVFITHESSCVVCRSCETACPSGVQFGILMEQTREIIAKTSKPNWLRRFIYTKLLGSPKAVRLLQYPISLFSKTPFARLFEQTFDGKTFPLKRFASSLQLLPDDIQFPKKRPLMYPAKGKKQGSVGLLIGCIGDLFTLQVNDATIKVLMHLGYDVHTMPEITCCGALAAHSGFGDRARELALNAISAIESSTIDFYISNIAGCGAMLKDYDKLFEGSSDHDRAINVRKKMRDISEFLLEFHEDDLLQMNLQLPEKTSIGYQAPCHLYHGQQIKDTPLELLKFIRNADVFPFEENDICCGSAGTYNIEHPEMGEALLERKMTIVGKHEPDMIATANAGCLMQLAKGARESGSRARVKHVVEIIADSIPS